MVEPIRDGKKLYYAYIEEIWYDTKWFYASNDEEAEKISHKLHSHGKMKPALFERVYCNDYGVEPDPKDIPEDAITEVEYDD